MQTDEIIHLIQWGLGGMCTAGIAGITALWAWFKSQLSDMRTETVQHRQIVQNQLADCESDRDATAKKLEAASEVVGAILTCRQAGCTIATSLGITRRIELKEQLDAPRPEKIGPSPTTTQQLK